MSMMPDNFKASNESIRGGPSSRSEVEARRTTEVLVNLTMGVLWLIKARVLLTNA